MLRAEILRDFLPPPGNLAETGLIIKLKLFSNHLKLFLNSVGRVSSKENSFQVKLTGYFIKMNHFISEEDNWVGDISKTFNEYK